MADYTIPNLTTANVGVNTSIYFTVQSIAAYTVSVSNGTVSLVNVSPSDFNILTNTIPGWLTGRRPSQGQVFPRGVYNK